MTTFFLSIFVFGIFVQNLCWAESHDLWRSSLFEFRQFNEVVDFISMLTIFRLAETLCKFRALFRYSLILPATTIFILFGNK